MVGHGRVGDDGSLSPLPHHPWPRRTRGYLALSFRAPLISGPLFCRLFFFLYGYYQNLLLLLSFILVALFVAMSSQILVQVLTRGFWFSILTFVFFMSIWMSWLWLDRIMMFWFVLNLKSCIAAISQSSISLAFVAPNNGNETLLLVPRVWHCILRKDLASYGRASWSVPAMNPVYFVFVVG